MPIEVEVKLRLESIEELEYLLVEKKAQLLKIVTQRDIYFTHPARDFSNTDEALRIRQEGEKTILTYKGPKFDKLSKTRLELEVQLEEAETIQQILQQLGFQPVLIIQKERRIYRYKQATISLDYIESLGAFLEIEQVIQEKEQYKNARNNLFGLLRELGLQPEKSIRKSYLELLLEQQKAK